MHNDTTISATIPASSATDDAARAIDAELKHEPPKRNKTWGEHIFNWRTYGGIALLGNEAASLLITEAVPKIGLTKGLYDKGIKLSARLNFAPAYVSKGRMFDVLLAVIGGMLMVPFIKYAEDHKGEQVRKLDRKHYGELTDSDPKLIEAHKEMDEAPKQTWGSLWKGRAITVVAALGVDSLVGWKDAPSKKLFSNPMAQKFSTMTGIAEQTSEGVVTALGKMGVKFSENSALTTKTWVTKATWLLVLSSTLTVLFYASSKLFAKKQEEKIERKEEQRAMRNSGTYADSSGEALATTHAEIATEKPTPQVKSISREETISSMPQLSQGA